MSRPGRNSPAPADRAANETLLRELRGRPTRARTRAPRALRRQAALTLEHFTELRLAELFDELPDLPERDLSLQVTLPELVSPELARFYEAIADDDIDGADALLPDLLARIDTPRNRAQLADAIAELRAAGRLEEALAAAAHIDLVSDSQLLIRASLIEAAALAAGAVRTPGGLLLAA